MSHKRRLYALQQHYIRREAAKAGAPYSLSAEEVLDEARRLLRLSLEEQLAEVDRHEAALRRRGFTEADVAHLCDTLTKHYRPLD
jgi:hypothetical protein